MPPCGWNQLQARFSFSISSVRGDSDSPSVTAACNTRMEGSPVCQGARRAGKLQGKGRDGALALTVCLQNKRTRLRAAEPEPSGRLRLRGLFTSDVIVSLFLVADFRVK